MHDLVVLVRVRVWLGDEARVVVLVVLVVDVGVLMALAREERDAGGHHRGSHCFAEGEALAEERDGEQRAGERRRGEQR